MALSLSGTTGIVTANIATLQVTTGRLADAAVTPGKLSQPMTLATAQNATGTSIDFTGIPSWAKRITVMFSGVSTNGASDVVLRLGTTSGIVAAGYISTLNTLYSSILVTQETTGFLVIDATASYTHGGSVIISYLGSSNTWVLSGIVAASSAQAITSSGCSPNLGATLDRIRLTMLNGTDYFDAGSVNIMYEG